MGEYHGVVNSDGTAVPCVVPGPYGIPGSFSIDKACRNCGQISTINEENIMIDTGTRFLNDKGEATYRLGYGRCDVCRYLNSIKDKDIPSLVKKRIIARNSLFARCKNAKCDVIFRKDDTVFTGPSSLEAWCCMMFCCAAREHSCRCGYKTYVPLYVFRN